MKMKKSQIRKIIAEEMATINKDTIEDTVLGVLSDEGGAAGQEPIEAALEDLEDENMELPEESIEDIIASVVGVKRHADGDYVDTAKLESRARADFKGRIRQIVENQMTPDSEVMDRLKDGLMAIGLDRIINRGDGDLESEVVQFVMDTSTMDRDRVYVAIERLAIELNLM